MSSYLYYIIYRNPTSNSYIMSKCFVSPVARQMTSNMVVAMRDVVQMCFVGFSIQIERAAVAESVAFFTHCRAIQLS